jgi:hypothetical protein
VLTTFAGVPCGVCTALLPACLVYAQTVSLDIRLRLVSEWSGKMKILIKLLPVLILPQQWEPGPPVASLPH